MISKGVKFFLLLTVVICITTGAAEAATKRSKLSQRVRRLENRLSFANTKIAELEAKLLLVSEQLAELPKLEDRLEQLAQKVEETTANLVTRTEKLVALEQGTNSKFESLAADISEIRNVKENFSWMLLLVIGLYLSLGVSIYYTITWVQKHRFVSPRLE